MSSSHYTRPIGIFHSCQSLDGLAWVGLQCFPGWQACPCCQSGLACSPGHWFFQSRAAFRHSDCGWTALSCFDNFGSWQISGLVRKFLFHVWARQMLFQHLVPDGVRLYFCLSTLKAVDLLVRFFVVQVFSWTLVFALSGCPCSTSRQMSLTQLFYVFRG